jgi:hypothetical protein
MFLNIFGDLHHSFLFANIINEETIVVFRLLMPLSPPSSAKRSSHPRRGATTFTNPKKKFRPSPTSYGLPVGGVPFGSSPTGPSYSASDFVTPAGVPGFTFGRDSSTGRPAQYGFGDGASCASGGSVDPRPSFVTGKLKPPSGPFGLSSGGGPKRRAPTFPLRSDFATSPFGKLKPLFGPSGYPGGGPKTWAPTFFSGDVHMDLMEDYYQAPPPPYYAPPHMDFRHISDHQRRHPPPAVYYPPYYEHNGNGKNYQHIPPGGFIYQDIRDDRRGPPPHFGGYSFHPQHHHQHHNYHDADSGEEALTEESNHHHQPPVHPDDSDQVNRRQPASQAPARSWFESSASSSSSSVDCGAGRWDPYLEHEDDSEDEETRSLKQNKVGKAAIHKIKKKKRNCSTTHSSSMPVVRKKKDCISRSRRYCFIDDEAVETNEDDMQESSEEEEDQESSEEEEDQQESEEEDDSVREEDEEKNNASEDNNNLNVDEDSDDDSNHQLPPLFESSSADEHSVNDEDENNSHDSSQQQIPHLFESSSSADDVSVKDTTLQQSFQSLYESSDDESLNTTPASSASLQTQSNTLLQETVDVKQSQTMFECPIITSFPRPSYSKDRIQEFKYNHENAPCHRDAVITYETMGDDIHLQKEPLESKGIQEVHSFVKQGRGLLWHNRTSAKLHYETSMSTYQDFVVPKASKAGIPSRLFKSDSSSLQRVVDGPNIFLFQSGSFENFHEKLCFQELIRDACIPAPHTVPRMDAVRENSGPSVGLCTSQGLTRGQNESFAIPGWLAGTHRYMTVFDIISRTTKSFLDYANLSDRLPVTNHSASPKQKFYNQRCHDLCEGNLYLSLSFKIYVHQPKNVQNHDGHFRAHRDLQNPDRDSPNDFMFCAWDTWFEPLLNLNVTGTIIACGRRSQEELFDRILRVEKATAHILSCAELIPSDEKEIDDSSFCPKGCEFILKGSHLLQIHALTPNHYLHQLNLKLGKDGGLSAYLAVEIILAFHQTSNNALRFHRFMSDLLGKVHTHNDLLEYVGELNVVERFQKYCYEQYGGYEGVSNRLSQHEGTVRHQSSVSCPVSLHANQRSMRSLIRTLGLFSSSPFNNSQYLQLVKQVKEDVIFLGDLKSQKLLMNFASVGLFIPRNYLDYFATGSRVRQLKNLERFGFQSQDEINQLRRHLVHKLKILPMQADEYICSLSGTEPNEASIRNRTGGETFYKNHVVHVALRCPDGSVGVEYYSKKQKRCVPAPDILTFNYNQDQDNHYVPTWAKQEELHGSTKISLSSSVNLDHMVSKKKSLALDFLHSRRITPGDFNPLLMSGFYVVVKDLVFEAAAHLDSTIPLVVAAMAVFRRSSKRFCAAVDYSKFPQTTSKPTYHPGQLISYKPSCLPRFLSGETNPGTYKDSHSAKCAALLHLLLNVGVLDKPNGWANKFFSSTSSNYQGFLLLIPMSDQETESFCLATAFIYLNKEQSIMCSMIRDDGTGDEPYECGIVSQQKKG